MIDDYSFAMAFALFCFLFLLSLYAWMLREYKRAQAMDYVQRQKNLIDHRSLCESIDLSSLTNGELLLLRDDVNDRLKMKVQNDSDAEYHKIDSELLSRIETAISEINQLRKVKGVKFNPVLVCTKCGYSTGPRHHRARGCRCNRKTDKDLFCDGVMIPKFESVRRVS